MWQDFRSGLRSLRQNPRFALLAILALALGMGATSAMFSIIDGVLLRPLAYRDPARLVVVMQQSLRGGALVPVAPGDFEDWKAHNRVFSSISAAVAWGVNLTGRDRPEQLAGMRVSSDLFTALGVPPLLGRTFLPEDARPENRHVVMLSYALWQRRFGSDRTILGRSLTLNGEDYIVIGVMPPAFRFAPFWATRTEIWAPAPYSPQQAQDRNLHMLRTFARLRQGVTLEQARAEMRGIARRLEQAYPRTNSGAGTAVVPLAEMAAGSVRPALLVLLGAVGFLLLIACVNVANLLLTRAADRRKEIAVRLALGASRWRLVRQLLAESAILGIAGGTIGLTLTLWIVRLAATAVPAAARFELPRRQDVAVNGTVLLFTLLLAVVSSVLFGLAPALQASRQQLRDALGEGGRGTSGRHRIGDGMVIAETALALILLAGSGLLLRSYQKLQNLDPGFRPENVWTMEVSVAGSREAEPSRRAIFFRELLQRVRAIPGVDAAGAINHVPLAGDLWSQSFVLEDRALPPPGATPNAAWRVVQPGYFRAMGIRLQAGRDLTDQDTEATPGVAVVNQTMARRYWPSSTAIGKRFHWGDAQGRGPWITIVGVVRDVEQWERAAPPKDEIYVSYWQDAFYQHDPSPHFGMTLVAHAAGNDPGMGSALQDALWSLDRNLPVVSLNRMEQVVSNALWQPRAAALLLTAFAALAMLLAAVGIYGVISYAVARRTQELGVRVALGARPADVLRLVVGQGMRLVGLGVFLGLAGAAMLTRLLSGMLYQVGTVDPAIFLLAAAALAAVALAAILAPAYRAARAPPWPP